MSAWPNEVLCNPADRLPLFPLPVRLLLMGLTAIALPFTLTYPVAAGKSAHLGVVNRLRPLPPSLGILGLPTMIMKPNGARWQRQAAPDARITNLL